MNPEREVFEENNPKSAEHQKMEGRLYSQRVVAILLAGALSIGYVVEPKIQGIIDSVVESIGEGVSRIKG